MSTTIYLNASAMVNSGCRRRIKLTVVDGLTGHYSVNDIEFGSALHHFRETLKRTGDKYLATKAGNDYFLSVSYKIKKNKEFLNINTLTATMLAYMEHFGEKHGRDDFESFIFRDKPLVEQTFCFTIYESPLGEVKLCGTIDDFGKLRNGCVGVLDLKTTTAWDKKEFFARYELSAQLLTYQYAIKHYATHHPSSFFGQFKDTRIGGYIDAVFLAKDKLPEFQRKFYPPNDLLLEEFEGELINLAKQLLEDSVIPLPPRQGVITGACEPKYKEPCPYRGACASPDEKSAQAILNNFFERKPYNPLMFRKLPENKDA